jgi:hypothetical protein
MSDSLRSPKLQSWHLDRAAVVYVRQSPPQQVLGHKESTARQYAPVDRAVALGWTRAAGWELVDQQVTNPPPTTGGAFPNPGGGGIGGPTNRMTTATLLFKRRTQ